MVRILEVKSEIVMMNMLGKLMRYVGNMKEQTYMINKNKNSGKTETEMLVTRHCK